MRQPLRRQLVSEAEPAQSVAAQVNDLGMARSARSVGMVAVGSVGGLPSAGPDPKTLVTKRGEKAGPKRPVHAVNQSRRDDPCFCGSGKKYEGCPGR
jgi:hypothetical protein